MSKNKGKTSVIQKHAETIFGGNLSNHTSQQSFELHYNYDNLDDFKVKKLQSLTIQLRGLYAKHIQSVVEIGRYLDYIKTELLKHGEFMDWVREEFEKPGYFTHHTANNFINCWQMLRQHPEFNEAALSLNLNALYALSRRNVPKQARIDVLERASRGESLKLSEVKHIVNHYKYKTPVIDVESCPITPSKTKTVTKRWEIEIKEFEDASLDALVYEVEGEQDNLELLFEEAYYKLKSGGTILIACLPNHYEKVLKTDKKFNFGWSTTLKRSGQPITMNNYGIRSRFISLFIFYKDFLTPDFVLEDLYDNEEEGVNTVLKALGKNPDAENQILHIVGSKNNAMPIVPETNYVIQPET